MLSYNPLKMEIQNPSIGITVNNSLLGVSFTNNELEISNFPTDYATELTLSSIDNRLTTSNTHLSTLNLTNGYLNNIDSQTSELEQLLIRIDTNTDSIDTKLSTTNTNLTGLATQTTLSAIETDTGSIDTKLTTTNNNLSNIDTNTTGLATQATLNTTNTHLVNITTYINTTNTNLSNIETDTTSIDTKLTTIIDGNFTNKYNNNKLFTITQRLGNFSASGTYYWNQYNDTKYIRIDPGVNTVAISSSNVNDTNMDFYIEGYNADGDKLSEILTSNGQTKVSSSNSYIGITDFLYASNSGAKNNGTVYLYRNSESITNGVPDTFKYACITNADRTKKGYIGHIYIPDGKTLQIHNIQINKCGGSSNHNILLNKIHIEGSWSPLHIGSKGMIIGEWICSANHFFDYQGSWMIANNTSSINASVVVFEALSSAVDTSAIIEIKVSFSFI